MPEPLLEIDGIEKAFGPVRALRGVSARLEQGQVLGLIGENGAGKSTLMNVLTGVAQPDRGNMRLAGERYAPMSPLEGMRAGIAAIHQELSLAPHLSVEANITLGRELSQIGMMRSQRARVREVLALLQHGDIDPGVPVSELSLARQQTVASGALEETADDELIRHMVGREVGELYPQSQRRPGKVLLRVGDLSGSDGKPSDADITIRRGEILGLAGLVGAGRSETLRSLFGLHRAVTGHLVVNGRSELQVRELTPAHALEQGVDLLSEDRQLEGLALGMSISANVTLSALGRYRKWGLLDRRREDDGAAGWARRLGIKMLGTDSATATLSGGNQQRVCLARLLHRDADVLLMDEPTRGIDIGTKARIYRLMHELANSGKGLMMTSSYLPELFGVCDTLAVVHRGAISAPRPVDGWTMEEVMRLATSGAPDPGRQVRTAGSEPA